MSIMFPKRYCKNAECNSVWEVTNGSLRSRGSASCSEAIKKLIGPLWLLGKIGLLLNEIGKLIRAHEGCVCVLIIPLFEVLM